MELFTDALETFKNLSSHRDIEFSDLKKVADIIHLANQLFADCEINK